MKRLLLAVALACAFASSAWAQPAVNATRSFYKEVYNSTADDASTHTVGGTAYTTDSLAVSFGPTPFGLRYIQFLAMADSAVAGGTITADSLQVRMIGTNSNVTQVGNNGAVIPSLLKLGAITGAALTNGPALETWYIVDTTGGSPVPMPAMMVRLKFIAGGTSANRIKNLRIWAIGWTY